MGLFGKSDAEISADKIEAALKNNSNVTAALPLYDDAAIRVLESRFSQIYKDDKGFADKTVGETRRQERLGKLALLKKLKPIQDNLTKGDTASSEVIPLDNGAVNAAVELGLSGYSEFFAVKELIEKNTVKNLLVKTQLVDGFSKMDAEVRQNVGAGHQAKELLQDAAKGYAELGMLLQTVKTLTDLEQKYDYQFRYILDMITGMPKAEGERHDSKKYANPQQVITLAAAALKVRSIKKTLYDHSADIKLHFLEDFDGEMATEVLKVVTSDYNRDLDNSTIEMLVKHAKTNRQSQNFDPSKPALSPSQRVALQALVAENGINILATDASDKLPRGEYENDVVKEFYDTALSEINLGNIHYIQRFMYSMKATEELLNAHTLFKENYLTTRVPTTLDDLIKGQGSGPARVTMQLVYNIFKERVATQVDVEGARESDAMKQEMSNLAFLVKDILTDNQLRPEEKANAKFFAREMILFENEHKIEGGERKTPLILSQAAITNFDLDMDAPTPNEGYMLKMVSELPDRDKAIKDEILQGVDEQWRGLVASGGAARPENYIQKMRVTA